MKSYFPGLLEYVGTAVRLDARNRLALFYGYLFPVIFLFAFLVLYRYDDVKLIRHMGELLTVSVLGGACFGLPTALVGERERGIWRRFRLAPIPLGRLLAGALVARYFAILGAGILQLLIAMAVGGWVPAHPFDLWVAFSLCTFAFVGIGLVMTALAGTVQAAQALGQCIFLPMLMVGGVAVRITTLPDWVQTVSAFLPGRYAVESLQAAVTSDGLHGMGFQVSAMLLIGAAACVAGVKLFRWDAQKRTSPAADRGWIAVALAAWVVVGSIAIQQNRVVPRPGSALSDLLSLNQENAAKAEGPTNAEGAAKPDLSAVGLAKAEPWRAMTVFNFASLPIADMPPDEGNVSPLAGEGQSATGSSLQHLNRIAEALPKWGPGHVPDRVQSVRNYLAFIGGADFAQSPLERYLPGVVLEQMLKEIPANELAQILCWIALHPEEGEMPPPNDPLIAEVGASRLDQAEVRNRTYYYAVKLTRWVIGW